MQVFLQILAFLVTNRAAIVQIIQSIEELIPDAPGNQKAAAVKQAIATSLSIEAQIETVWPMISPIFNLIVAAVKGPKTAA